MEMKNDGMAGGWSGFVELLRLAKPAKWLLVVAIVLSLLEAVAGLVVPLFTKDLIDQFQQPGFLGGGTIVWLVLAFVLQTVTGGFSFYLMTYIGESFVAKIRSLLWEHLLFLRVDHFDRHESGALMSRVTQDTSTVKTLMTNHLVTLVSGLVSIVGAVAILLIIDWRMTLIMLGSVPVAMLILMPIGRKVYKISLETQDQLASFSAQLARVLSEIRLVKAYNAQSVESEAGKGMVGKLFGYGLREARIQAFVSPLMTTVIMAVLVVLIGYGGARVASGDLSAGSLVAVILYMFQIVVPFTQLASFFTAFQKAMGATLRIQELLHTEREEDTASVNTAAAVMKPINWQQPVRFEYVSFGYRPEEPILRGLQCAIEPGQSVAFVGPSGSGKTTIFSLLERFYTPTEGAIRLGSDAIQELPLQAWREGIGYVSQESPMMSGTIRENISYGLGRPVSDEELVEAAQQAGAVEFIERLPQGYDTEVGERGMKLSGGQRQRLAIARALLRNPRLLLLDEATSNLDSESESLVQKALERLMEGRTTLIIAHRLSTVLEADRIIFLDRGVITGQGTHEELMESHELYRRFVHQQLKHEEAPAKSEEQGALR
ncbi:ABC transporter ATP-binding protein [Paenibacillus turpanensis]|uniref:ABC transporter ATP-binding protein n=1 Tax=Paenibacillus turpanensis TaxID=2689078 RepID=UPI00140E72F4|nr:ABC transporter ATP-binding protein [Paenibacillus turpanensis]